jgi:uncharacterized membrane protein
MQKNIIPNRVPIIIYAVVLAIFGIMHFLKADMMATIVPIPGGKIWVYITGLALILAAIAFIINIGVKPAGYLLALFLLIVIVLIHAPHAMDDPQSMTALLKDAGLMAAAIIIANTGK